MFTEITVLASPKIGVHIDLHPESKIEKPPAGEPWARALKPLVAGDPEAVAVF
jgi:hypothetical protein